MSKHYSNTIVASSLHVSKVWLLIFSIMSSTLFVSCANLPGQSNDASASSQNKRQTTSVSRIPNNTGAFFFETLKLIESYYAIDFDRCMALYESLSVLSADKPPLSPEQCEQLHSADTLGVGAKMRVYREVVQSYMQEQQLDSKLLTRRSVAMIEAFLQTLERSHLFDFTAHYGNIPIGVMTHPDGSGAILLVDKGTSAERYALQPRDIIVSVNGVSVDSMSGNDELLQRLQAKPFDVLNLEVETTERRRRIAMRVLPALPEGMEVTWLNDYVLYWRIDELSADSRKYARRLFGQAIRSSETQPLELAIDLRGVKGGDIVGAIELADMFVAKGALMYGQSHHQAHLFSVPAKANNVFMSGVFIQVLVDGGTQGAAEVLAASLKRNHESVEVIGARTAGHDVVQRRFPTVKPHIFLDLLLRQQQKIPLILEKMI